MSPETVTFTAANWNVQQTVTVTDTVVDGDSSYSIITGPAGSADLTYNGLNPPDVSVTVQDTPPPPPAPTE